MSTIIDVKAIVQNDAVQAFAILGDTWETASDLLCAFDGDVQAIREAIGSPHWG